MAPQALMFLRTPTLVRLIPAEEWSRPSYMWSRPTRSGSNPMRNGWAPSPTPRFRCSSEPSTPPPLRDGSVWCLASPRPLVRYNMTRKALPADRNCTFPRWGADVRCHSPASGRQVVQRERSWQRAQCPLPAAAAQPRRRCIALPARLKGILAMSATRVEWPLNPGGRSSATTRTTSP